MAKRRNGFTLLEVVLGLTLAGVLFGAGVTGYLWIARGYLFAQTNSETALQGQLSITRLARELTVLSSVTAATATSLTYTSYKVASANPQPESHTIGWAGPGNPLTIDGKTLVDQVNSFQMDYYDSYTDSGASPAWGPGRKVINVALKLNGADGTVSDFGLRIVPRNL